MKYFLLFWVALFPVRIFCMCFYINMSIDGEMGDVRAILSNRLYSIQGILEGRYIHFSYTVTMLGNDHLIVWELAINEPGIEGKIVMRKGYKVTRNACDSHVASTDKGGIRVFLCFSWLMCFG